MRAIRCSSLHRLGVSSIVCVFTTTALAAELEKLLANPPARGLLIVGFVRDAPGEKKGLREGDILQKYAGLELKSVDHLKQVIAQKEKQKTIDVELVRDGRTAHVLVGPGPLGVRTSRLEKGKPKWKRSPRSTYTPDLSGLTGETWMSYLLSGKHAGFEYRALNVKAAGNGIEAQYRVAFAGEGFDDSYRVTLQMGKGGPLSFHSVRFVRRTNKELVVEARRDGNRIVGMRHGKPESMSAVPDLVPSYAVADFAATLPFKIGFTVGFNVFEEDEFGVQPGHDLVCVAREKLHAGAKSMDAWVYEDRQYGEPGNRYWFDRKRKLVKATWEGHASSVATSKDEALRGLPVRISSFAR